MGGQIDITPQPGQITYGLADFNRLTGLLADSKKFVIHALDGTGPDFELTLSEIRTGTRFIAPALPIEPTGGEPREIAVTEQNIHSDPDVSSPTLTTVKQGDKVVVTGSVIGGLYHWALVLSINGHPFELAGQPTTGYIARELLK